MPSQMVRGYIALAATLACGIALPAYAGWGNNFVRGVLPSLVKHVAVSLIQQELYDLESQQSPGNYQPQPGNDAFMPYPSSQSRFIPESQFQATSKMRAPRSDYQWTPRPALDYLPGADEQQQRPRQRQQSTSRAAHAFTSGAAGHFSYDQLVSAKVFTSAPLQGSIFKRLGAVKYIILHSTETGSPADARRVIQSWNNRGLRHPGAQFVVDRDGTICSTTNPDLATVHINTSKTLAGYSNDNSVGIEIVRSGKQRYTQPQLESVVCLVSYLQSHYGISDSDITTHHHVQPSDRSDPVGFDLAAFALAKSNLRNAALARSNVPTAPYEEAVHPVAPAFSQGRRSILSTMPKPAPDFRMARLRQDYR